MGVFIKDSMDEVNKHFAVEVVSPKAKVLPYKWFPHHEFAELPEKEQIGKYLVHYPRYFYPVPKKLFYRFTPYFYSRSVTPYALANIKKPSLIHCHNPYPDGPGVLELAKQWNIPLVVHVRGSMDYYLDSGSMSLLVKALHKANAVISVNEKQKEYFVRKGIEAKKIYVVPNGVDTNLFKPRPKAAVRKQLGLSANKKIILFVGSLIPLKDLDTFVHAVKHFEKDTQVIIIGEGPLRKQVQEALPQATLTGMLPREQTAKYMNAADIFVISSVSEGRPNTMYEALASNLAIIATEVGGIPEVITNNKNGLLVPPKSPLMLRQAIQELLKNEALRKKISSQGTKTIQEQNLTWEYHAQKLLEVYRKVLKK